jgi:hypothetical protein
MDHLFNRYGRQSGIVGLSTERIATTCAHPAHRVGWDITTVHLATECSLNMAARRFTKARSIGCSKETQGKPAT